MVCLFFFSSNYNFPLLLFHPKGQIILLSQNHRDRAQLTLKPGRHFDFLSCILGFFFILTVLVYASQKERGMLSTMEDAV